MPKTIKITDVDASGRLRPVNPDQVAFFAAAIEQKGGGKIGEGMNAPITVRPAGDGFKLVKGGHRLGAMTLLGWSELVVGKHVVIEEMDDFDARIEEIDENLIRADLNALDRALFIAERKRLCSDRRLKNGGDRKSVKFKEEISSQTLRTDFSPRFTEEVAEKVGLSERSVQLALYIAEKLDPQAIAKLRGTRIERNQQALLALCDMPPQNQFKIAVAIRNGEAKTVAEARVKIGLDKPVTADAQARILSLLLANWDKANAVTRAAFLDAADLERAKKRGA